MPRRCWPSCSICQRRSMSPSSWSDSSCSWARCSGVIELSIACMAAIFWASCSSSSSSVSGFSGKKSPYCSMNSSKRGSSPRSRRSSISLSAAIMSFIRARSCGVSCCIAPLICSKSCVASCSRSRSSSDSKRRWASADSKEYSCSSRTLPARSDGRRSRRRLRSAAVSRAVSALRFAAGVVDGVALFVHDVLELASDLVVDTPEVEPVEPLLALAAELLQQLAHALQAFAVAIPEALVHHPPQRGVDVTVVQQLVGELLEQGVAVELEALLRAVPAGVLEPRRHGSRLPPDLRPKCLQSRARRVRMHY